jgi:hypothetical protein
VLHLTWGLFTLSYPKDWGLQRFTSTCSHGGYFEGAMITNLDTPLHHPRGACTTAWDMRRLSPSLVVMQIARNVGPVFQTRHPRKEDTRFPLSMKEAVHHRKGSFGAPPMREIRIWRKGLLAGSIDVWIGARASPQDSAAVGRAVRSIRDETPFCSYDLPRGSIYPCS